MYKRKKGFTLVEISISLTILSLLITIFAQGFNYFTCIKDNIVIKQEINKIHSFLMLGKSMCKEKNEYGTISYDEINNKLLYERGNNLDENSKIVEIFKSIKIENINTKAGIININDKGAIITPCTIKIKDSRGLEHKITINIGGGTIDVKE